MPSQILHFSLFFLSSIGFSGSSVLHVRAVRLYFVLESGTTLAIAHSQLDTGGTRVHQGTL